MGLDSLSMTRESGSLSAASRVGAAVDRLAVHAAAQLFTFRRPPERYADDTASRAAFTRYSDAALRADPARFFLPPPAPTHVTEAGRGRKVTLRFASDYRASHADAEERHDRFVENRTVHVTVLRHERPAPAVIALHPWCGGAPSLDGWLLGAEHLHRQGLDVYLMSLPFHGPRTPSGSFSGQQFPSPNIERTNESFAQAVWDARRVRLLALAHGSPSVGVMGMSLGACVASLVAVCERDLSFCVPLTPLVSVADVLWSAGEGRSERRAVEKRGVTRDVLERAFAVVAPLSYPLAIARERVLIVAARGDRITPPRHVELLWEHWQRPPIHWFEGGHLLHVGRGGALREMTRFIAAHASSVQ